MTYLLSKLLCSFNINPRHFSYTCNSCIKNKNPLYLLRGTGKPRVFLLISQQQSTPSSPASALLMAISPNSALLQETLTKANTESTFLCARMTMHASGKVSSALEENSDLVTAAFWDKAQRCLQRQEHSESTLKNPTVYIHIYLYIYFFFFEGGNLKLLNLKCKVRVTVTVVSGVYNLKAINRAGWAAGRLKFKTVSMA